MKPEQALENLGQPTSATEKRGLAVRGPVPCGAELGLGTLRESRRAARRLSSAGPSIACRV